MRSLRCLNTTEPPAVGTDQEPPGAKGTASQLTCRPRQPGPTSTYTASISARAVFALPRYHNQLNTLPARGMLRR
jgi:hypothetical protein